MANGEWRATDWPLLRKIETRAGTLRTNKARASALCNAAAKLPREPKWKPWPHLLILTIAGVHSCNRDPRIHLAETVSLYLSADELLSLTIGELEQDRGPGYMRQILLGRPGHCWSRLAYPLRWTCGLPHLRAEAVEDLSRLPETHAIRARQEAGEEVPALWQAVADTQMEANPFAEGTEEGARCAYVARELAALRARPRTSARAAHLGRSA